MTRTRRIAIECLSGSSTFQNANKTIRESMIVNIIVSLFGTKKQNERLQKKNVITMKFCVGSRT